MGTTFRSAAYRWDSEDINDSDVGNGQSRSVAAVDIFDDPTIVDELNEANASLIKGIVAPPTASVPARLPPVDEFDFDEACRAKNLANKLGPPDRDAKPRRGWLFPVIKSRRQDDEWSGPYGTAPRGLRRGFFWGFCASLAIVSVTPMILGIFRPLDGPLPRPIDDNRQGISTEVSTPGSISAPTINPEEKAGEPQEVVMVQRQPAAASVIGPTTNAFTTPLVPPTALDDRGEQIDDPVVSASEPSSIETEPAKTESTTPTSEFSVDPVAIVDDAAETSSNLAKTQSTERIEPTQLEQPELAHNVVVPSTEEVEKVEAEVEVDTVASPSDAAQRDAAAHAPSASEIDQLLARGEELLRSGNITSARMVFSHVAAAGDRRGAKAVGMTYDPDVFARLPVTGLSPDLEQAELWYERAGAASYTIDLTLPAPPVTEVEDSEAVALQQWNAACARKYRSFEPSTGLYTALSGAKRRCQLP